MPDPDPIDVEEALDELFATRPERFVVARNALVKTLKAVGLKDDATDVAALRKPNRVVWALNQLALDDDPTLAPLLEAAEEVHDGLGDLKSAMVDLRVAVNAAAAAAAGRLDARSSDRADLAAALLAVVADYGAADDLTHGRLLEVPAPDAFGLGLTAPAPRPAAKKADPKAKAKAVAEPADRPPDQLAIRRATKRLKEAAKETDAAARALARAQKAVDKETSALEEADEERATAAAALSAAEAALAQAKTDLQRAEAASTKAVHAQERAAGILAEAQERAEAAATELADATAARHELEA